MRKLIVEIDKLNAIVREIIEVLERPWRLKLPIFTDLKKLTAGDRCKRKASE